LDCNVKEQQNAAEGHTIKHTVRPTFYTEILYVSAGRHSVGGKTQRNGKKLVPAPQQRALSNCPYSAAVFGEEPNCSDPPTTLSTRSHSLQLLSLLKAQDQTQRSPFYISRRNSTEYCSMSQSHIKR